jgi:hypothetical protein
VTDQVLKARCEDCNKILDEVCLMEGVAGPQVFRFMRGLGTESKHSRPHIGRRELEYGDRAVTPADVEVFMRTLDWRCKCGRHIQRNGQKLVPAFVSAARAGTDLRV